MPVGRFCDEAPDSTGHQHDVNISGVGNGCPTVPAARD
jgi:hypothetical protein